jgi:hypothetical protein
MKSPALLARDAEPFLRKGKDRLEKPCSGWEIIWPSIDLHLREHQDVEH